MGMKCMYVCVLTVLDGWLVQKLSPAKTKLLGPFFGDIS